MALDFITKLTVFTSATQVDLAAVYQTLALINSSKREAIQIFGEIDFKLTTTLENQLLEAYDRMGVKATQSIAYIQAVSYLEKIITTSKLREKIKRFSSSSQFVNL